jgi:ABC-type bacteriocin/lantibiotic exporter with double-glycine peptidase domain
MQTYNELLHQSMDVRSVDSLILDHTRIARFVEHSPLQNWNRIDINDMTFVHNSNEAGHRGHLDRISLSIPSGAKIALVGQSGAGKSTLLALLRGIYAPDRVTAHIDGRLFDNLRPLSGFSTLIPQEAEIFENSVRYNLTLGIDMPEAFLRQSLEMAAFEDVLPKLPRGLDTDIREKGVNLSGGQKQRLALARGLIAARDSSLLLLDEPTSSVDAVTEGRIFDRIFSIYGEKSFVVSVHRLHLLPRFDWICVMENGKIVQQDTFHNLVTVEGPLRDLWESQTIERWEA